MGVSFMSQGDSEETSQECSSEEDDKT